MSHRNFDQALEGAQVAQIDATFDLGGREWHLAPMPDYLLMKWVSATGNAGRAGLLMQLIEKFTVADERADWLEYIADGRWDDVPDVGSGEDERKYYPPPDTDTFVKLISWSIEQRGEGRPTTPSSD